MGIRPGIIGISEFLCITTRQAGTWVATYIIHGMGVYKRGLSCRVQLSESGTCTWCSAEFVGAMVPKATPIGRAKGGVIGGGGDW